MQHHHKVEIYCVINKPASRNTCITSKTSEGKTIREKKRDEPWPKPLLLNWPHQGYYVSRKSFGGLFITARFEDITRGKRHYSRGDASMPVLSLPVLTRGESGGCAGKILEVKC